MTRVKIGKNSPLYEYKIRNFDTFIQNKNSKYGNILFFLNNSKF